MTFLDYIFLDYFGFSSQSGKFLGKNFMISLIIKSNYLLLGQKRSICPRLGGFYSTYSMCNTEQEGGGVSSQSWRFVFDAFS